MSTDWYCENILGSDRSAITLKITCEFQINKATEKKYTNFKKADWKSLRNESEQAFRKLALPKSTNECEKIFRKIICGAASGHIPQGCIKEVKLNFPTEALETPKIRDNFH